MRFQQRDPVKLQYIPHYECPKSFNINLFTLAVLSKLAVISLSPSDEKCIATISPSCPYIYFITFNVFIHLPDSMSHIFAVWSIEPQNIILIYL